MYYFQLTFFLFQDPVAKGEAEIKKTFDELHENMQQAFRNLEDWGCDHINSSVFS